MINTEKKPLIMGILNYTPDSFSDGGKYFTPETALEHALFLKQNGADIIDIGANSTRPGAEILAEKEEGERLTQVLSALKGKVDIPISVDTFYPECAEISLDFGAEIINDVSGTFNVEIAKKVLSKKAYYVVTHNPCGASDTCEYINGVVSDVRLFFIDCIAKAAEIGFPKEKLIFDPGFGFGKTISDNEEMLENLEWLKINGMLLLVGLSRKRFIKARCNGENIDLETKKANELAVLNGADIIRTHSW